MGKKNKSKEDLAISRIAALVLINAMIFHESLSQKDSRIIPLQRFASSKELITDLSAHWEYILNKINYYPIFYTAYELINEIAANEEIARALKNFIKTAREIVRWRAALRHDLAGRIYHRLLLEAKYLGAYYTSIPAAALLLKLTLKQNHSSLDWSNLKQISELRIADFACGTGTLLMATMDAITDNYIRSCVIKHKKPILNKLHKKLLENVIWGLDVLMSAIHLTASTLMLRDPENPIEETNLYCLKMGGDKMNLGSLELIKRDALPQFLFKTSKQITSEKAKETTVEIPKLDLCVMNPPFTSSRRANLLFGSMPDDERKLMQKRLSGLIRKNNLPANLTAGLSSVFTALAESYLKDNGYLALVLPRTVLSGISWKKTRDLIAEKFHLEFIVVSHEPKHWNFSENTNLSEALIVARKRQDSFNNDEDVICVNLWKNCKKPIEALSLANSILEGKPEKIENAISAKQIIVGDTKYGEAIRISWEKLKNNDTWDYPCSFAQFELIKSFDKLKDGVVSIPTVDADKKIPLCPLNQVGYLGYDPRDIYDGFDLAKGRTAYPALWGHDSKRILCIGQENNCYLEPLTEPRPKRKVLRDANYLWEKSSNVLISQRTRLNTKRVLAVLTDQKVLSDVWWMHIPDDSGRRFRSKPATDSD